MKRVLITAVLGVAVFGTGAAHAACAGTSCVDLNIARFVSNDICDTDHTSSACCAEYYYQGQRVFHQCI